MSSSTKTMKCHYEVMEVERSASTEEIKKQYRKLALRHHPDRNIGNEETATEAFKLITSAYSVLSDPQERQWYDDHREAILRGGNGTKTDDDDSDSEEYVINLWKYFNASCFDGFDDSPKGFYVVYGDVFSRIWAQEQESSSKIHSDEPKFGNADSPAPDVLRFYNHWSCFASCRNFSWEDKYNQSEAPNRQVRRAIEKENQKFRDTGKRTFNTLVHSLLRYVRKRDPRINSIEIENSRKMQEEEQKRKLLREESKAKRKEMKELNRLLYENDEEEKARREGERERAFLLADDSEAEDALDDDEVTVPYDSDDIDNQEKILQDYLNKSEAVYEDPDDNLTEEEELFQCDICSKNFKLESQLNQHLSSKVHRKKAQEMEKKFKGKNKTNDKKAVASKDSEVSVPNEPLNSEKSSSNKVERSQDKGKTKHLNDDKDEIIDEEDSAGFAYVTSKESLTVAEEESVSASFDKLNVLEETRNVRKQRPDNASRGKSQVDSNLPRDSGENDAISEFNCRECGWVGETRNKLFQHLKATGHMLSTKVADDVPMRDSTSDRKKSKRKGGLK